MTGATLLYWKSARFEGREKLRFCFRFNMYEFTYLACRNDDW